MSTKVQSHHKAINSFNPAWCLRPPIKTTTPRNTNIITNRNKSPLTSPFCPKSIKSNHRQHHCSPELSVEPTSPRVGCMGQIRKCKAPSSSSSSSAAAAASVSPTNVNGQFNLMMLKRGGSNNGTVHAPTSLLMHMRLVEMDPPKPVEMKKVRLVTENSVGLWRRRRCGGGDGLKIQLPSMEETHVSQDSQICTCKNIQTYIQ